MDARSGFSTPNLLEAETNRALIGAGRRLVVLADHTKWGTVGISSVGRLDEADTIITDSGLDPAARGLIAETIHRLIVVDVATGDRTIIEDDREVVSPGGGGRA
jgi:DeoR/GlpR family transcriptional regulator of sugar metabolism